MKTQPFLRNRYVLLGDLLLIVISVLGSYALRFELGAQFFDYLPSALWMIGLGLIIKPLVYHLFGLYQRIWAYASVEELELIVVAVTAASILLAGGMVIALSLGAFVGMPRSVLVIDWLLSLIFAGGLRLSFRLMAESRGQGVALASQPRRVLIVGAGDAGALVVREMQKNPQLNLQPIGFLDDNPAKQKQQIHGVPVIGTLSELAQVLERQRVDEVIIAIPSAPGRVVRVVADIARLKGVPFRTMPGIYELLGGKVSVSRLREVDISDLLRREPLQVNEDLVGAALSSRVVLVTGAGGSIGRELCRQIARWGPKLLILLGHGENSIFETLLELRESFPGLNVQPVIADIRDRPRLEVVFNEFHPEVVFHAAAHKHVPLMEINVEEAVTNNVLGTLNLVEVSLAYLVERFVFISTDKAIRPVNVMGATKRLAEMIVLNAAQRSGGRYSVVRFGNVLGSRGSVVPIFKRQIAQGGPVTVTHPDMKRYFMTIPEAAHLVLQVAGMGRGGDTYLLNMGQQIRILDLAEDLIRLSGLEPGRDIEIVFTGIRPGEKLSEDLWDEGVSLRVTDHPDIFRVENQEVLEGEALYQVITELVKLAREGDRERVVALLDEVIPGSAIRSTPPPELTSVV
ncbi:nucleoside-diphosphate sugar epimerase/dehydratase [uncultured Thermanaerothrix sp.]|uniref:polysaccharide biosynthesis protein n=1 Tax=uncultured Thermanaerothrix sp. TaxID=1195149 RepID=UPI00262A2807|nr:nucleoside-diphosphate sugar epimerase/dehydratase [uncultured Thermanaerothrix sp.]